MEILAREMANPPQMLFLSQRLHDFPEKLREGAQAEIDRIEAQRPEIDKIGLGYGLCGKGLAGVSARRATLVIPRLHDCIPLLLGLEPSSPEASSRDGKTYWISPGWLESFLVEFHLTDARLNKYTEKFGRARAEKMVRAENALLAGYETACHIRWPEAGNGWVAKARAVADSVGLEYRERMGSSAYLREFIAGGEDPQKFLHLAPGMTIGMDERGAIREARL